MSGMRMRLFSFLLLLSLPAFAQQSIYTNNLRLQPTTLPSTCNPGDTRFDSSGRELNLCEPANTWSAVGSGAGGTWGTITGTLSDQTDLQSALDLKAPLASPTFTGTVTAPTFVGALTGNSSTATALAANPSDCSSNQYAITIAANGNLTCAQVNYNQLAGVLPNPSSSTLGGIESLASTSHQWINTISTSGVPSSTQPGFSDISGNLANSQLPTAETWPSSGTVQAITPSNHGVLVSGAGATASVVGPSASTVFPLVSGGSSANPSYSLLTVPGGGTGLATLTANNVMLGNGTSTPSFVAPGSSGNILTSNGTTWTSATPAGGGSLITAKFGLDPTTSGTLSVTGFSPVVFSYVYYDSNSAYNTSTGEFTCPATGYYLIVMTSFFTGAVQNDFFVYKNGSYLAGRMGTNSQPTIDSQVTQVPCTAAEKLTIVPDNATGLLYNASDFQPTVSITMLPPGGASSLSTGTFDTNSNSTGLFISSGVISTQSASATNPGMVNTGSQTFAGSKTIGNNASDSIQIGANSSTAVHFISGGLNQSINTITSSYTQDTSVKDYVIRVNCAAACTVTLLGPTNGRTLRIVDVSGAAFTNNITITPNGADTINGNANLIINVNNASVDLVGVAGTGWNVL